MIGMVETIESRAPAEASFYDRVAATYDRMMAADGTRAMRQRFLRLVRSQADPPGPILDFGCGTGVDARWYACAGYRVLAYDPSAGMLARLRRRCAGAIRTGRVVPVAGDVAACLHAARGMAPFGCIASNFSAFNHVEDPEPLLRDLAGLLAPGGRIVLSLMNPWYWRDLRGGWWWRARLASLRYRGRFVAGEENRVVRHEPLRLGRGAGLRRVSLQGARFGGAWGRLPGHPADFLVFLVLERKR